MRISLKGLKVVVFQEKQVNHPANGLVGTFDLPSFPNYLPDLDRHYCAHLLEKVLNFEKLMMKAFLEYQCRQKVNPIRWLSDLLLLVNENASLLIDIGCAKKMTDLFELIDELQTVLERFHSRSTRVKILDNENHKNEKKEFFDWSNPQPRQEYEKEYSPKLPWNGPTNVLADMFFQASQLLNEEGETLLPAKTMEIIEFIETHFYRLDGKPFSSASLKTYLSPSRSEKRPTKSSGIRVRLEEDLGKEMGDVEGLDL